jgi:hypothetical protein
MPKTKLVLVLGLAVLLVATAALAFVAKGASTAAQRTPSIAMADPDLSVPPALPLSGKWQARPATGSPATLPWANIRVNNDATREAPQRAVRGY